MNQTCLSFRCMKLHSSNGRFPTIGSTTISIFSPYQGFSPPFYARRVSVRVSPSSLVGFCFVESLEMKKSSFFELILGHLLDMTRFCPKQKKTFIQIRDTREMKNWEDEPIPPLEKKNNLKVSGMVIMWRV